MFSDENKLVWMASDSLAFLGRTYRKERKVSPKDSMVEAY